MDSLLIKVFVCLLKSKLFYYHYLTHSWSTIGYEGQPIHSLSMTVCFDWGQQHYCTIYCTYSSMSCRSAEYNQSVRHQGLFSQDRVSMMRNMPFPWEERSALCQWTTEQLLRSSRLSFGHHLSCKYRPPIDSGPETETRAQAQAIPMMISSSFSAD